MKIIRRKDWSRPSDPDAFITVLEADSTRPLSLNLQDRVEGPTLAIRGGPYAVELDWQDLDFLVTYLDERRRRHIQAFAVGARKVAKTLDPTMSSYDKWLRHLPGGVAPETPLAKRILDNVKPEDK